MGVLIKEGNKEEILAKIEEPQDVDTQRPPTVPIFIDVNPNPIQSRFSSILAKFKQFVSSIWNSKVETPSIVGGTVSTTGAPNQNPTTPEIPCTLQIGNLFNQFPKDAITYLYSQLFNPNSDLTAPEFSSSRLFYDTQLLTEAKNVLALDHYEGHQIIVDEAINPEVLAILATKFNSGEQFSSKETLIATTACLLMGGSNFEGMVNSASDFNENSFEKTDKNVRRLKVLSESMSGIPGLQPGAEVPLRIMPEGTQYKKGDIIVFYRDEIKIVHQVEYVHESNGEIFYVTTGVNTETNQYVDSDLVSQDNVIGVVDLSKEAYLELNEMMARRYVPFITAFGITQDLQNYLKFLNKNLASFTRGENPRCLPE